MTFSHLKEIDKLVTRPSWCIHSNRRRGIEQGCESCIYSNERWQKEALLEEQISATISEQSIGEE